MGTPGKIRYGKWLLSCISIICGLIVSAQPKTDSFLQRILSANTIRLCNEVLTNKDTFRVQVIYTQIDRDKHNRPSFHHYYFNVDSNIYFNPASTVKLPLALLSLEKLNSINKKGVDKYASIKIDSNYAWQTPMYADPTFRNRFTIHRPFH